MKKKNIVSLKMGSRQSKLGPESAIVQNLAGIFNQRDFARGLSATQSGFTLIELLVVIGIIAILAAVVIVAVNPAHQFALARDTQRSANVATILDAVDENMAEHKGVLTCNGVASILSADSSTSTISSDSTTGGNLASCLVPDYVASLPMDPTRGTFKDASDYDTGYQISKDSSGHVTVAATSELLPDNGLIKVTR